MGSTQDRSLDLKQYLRVVARRKGVIVLCAVAVFCAATITLRVVPKQYRSSAVLSIQERDLMSRRLEDVLGTNSVTRPYLYEERRQAKIVSDIRSRPFLEKVIRVLRMNEDPRLRDAARGEAERHPEFTVDEIAVRLLVKSLQSRIEVRSIGPGLYEFSVSDYSPDTAQLLTRWISELFIDNTTKQELDRIRAQRNFSQEQLRIYQEALERSQEALKRYRESMIGDALENNPVVAANLRAAETRLERVRGDRETAEVRVGVRARGAIDAGLPAEDPTIREDKQVQSSAASLKNAIHALTVGLLTSPGDERGLAALRSELANSRTDLYNKVSRLALDLYGAAGAAPMADYVFAQLDARTQADAEADLSYLIQDYKRQARNEPRQEIELTRLENDVKKDQEVLDSFKSQTVASEIQQAVETTNLGLHIEIVDPAARPIEPDWPRPPKVLVLALLMGPLLGIGFAFLAELLDPTLRTLEDIEEVAPEPVLGTLPLISSVVPVHRGLRRRWVPVTLAGVLLLTAVFFVTRDRLFSDLGVPRAAVNAVEPVEGGAP